MCCVADKEMNKEMFMFLFITLLVCYTVIAIVECSRLIFQSVFRLHQGSRSETESHKLGFQDDICQPYG